MSINKNLSRIISKKFAPLTIKAEKRDNDIVKWYIKISEIEFQAQSSGSIKEVLSHPYALTLWNSEQIIPLLTFLKEREKELSEYMKLWKGNNENN
ncbi:MAG: hypothetical protein J6M62_10250 [Selenomonadaceae bacterium]|nr:hypothetical protein [Selenomonadaceae bacterium]